MKIYTPQSIDTSNLELPKELRQLTEALSRNVHEVWAACRIAEGWSYGKVRNDLLKTHPCLVPYEELSESERDYDRHTAMETLKLIISLGYNVNK